MIDLSTVPIVIAAGMLVATCINHIRTTRQAAKVAQITLETRQAQLFMQIFTIFNQPQFFDMFTDILTWNWKDYDDFQKKYGHEANAKAWYSLGSVAAFFEGIGVLVHRNLLDIEVVSELMYRHIVIFWRKIEPISKEMRKRLNLPQVDVWIEYLYNEMLKIEPRIGKPSE